MKPTLPVFIMGSIPACAGKPAPCAKMRKKSRVYPRVCGETSSLQPPEIVAAGLSPRVRGNL